VAAQQLIRVVSVATQLWRPLLQRVVFEAKCLD